METIQTRRSMMKMASVAGLLLAGRGSSMAIAAQGGDIDSRGIGLTRPEWEEIVGEGSDVGDLVEYGNPEREGAEVLAQFGSGNRVTHLEFVFGEAGLPEEEFREQIDGALPADATLVDTFAISSVDGGRTRYRAERFVSETLGQMSNGLASILVVTHQLDADTGTGAVVPRVTLTMPGPHTLEARDVGNPGGIGLSREEWLALYGEPESTQGGDLFANEVVPDLQLLVQFTPGDQANLIDTVAQGMMPIVTYAEGKALVGSLLPNDAIMRETFLMPSRPENLAALSVETWECPSLADDMNETGSVIAVYEQAVDTDPVTVSRVAVALPEDVGSASDATPMASPVT